MNPEATIARGALAGILLGHSLLYLVKIGAPESRGQPRSTGIYREVFLTHEN